jgi:hypothetical protein
VSARPRAHGPEAVGASPKARGNRDEPVASANESGRSLQTSAIPSPCGSNEHLPHPPKTTPLCHDARASPARHHRWSWKRTRTATNERQLCCLACPLISRTKRIQPTRASASYAIDRRFSRHQKAPPTGEDSVTGTGNGTVLAFGRIRPESPATLASHDPWRQSGAPFVLR